MPSQSDAHVGGGETKPTVERDARSGSEPPPASPAEVLLGAESRRQPVVSVVMPTLNEEAGIAECIRRVRNALYDLGVYGEVIISDSSTDRTPAIAREHGAIVVEPDEPGYGYAYRYAFARTRGEYIVIGDADTTYDFEAIPRLLEPVRNGEADMCMGSRLAGEIEPGAMPALHKYVGNPLLTRFLNVFYDAGVSDAHSGFRVFHRDVLDTLQLETTGMEFASEMIMEAGARDLTIAERPIVYHEREGDATLDSFRDGWRHVRFMLLNAPGYLFTIPGVLMIGLGVLVMGFCLSGVELGPVGFGVHSMIGGSLLTLVGAQVASLGVFATIASDPIQAPTDRLTTWFTDQIRLEHGATAGLAFAGMGAAYTVLVVARWLASGLTQLPILLLNVVAFTAIVLGVQMVFSSFFLSAIADR